jgi:hypothetical protein
VITAVAGCTIDASPSTAECIRAPISHHMDLISKSWTPVRCLNHSRRIPRRSSAASNIPSFRLYSCVVITEFVYCVVLTRQRSLLPRNASGIPCSYPRRLLRRRQRIVRLPERLRGGLLRRPVMRRVRPLVQQHGLFSALPGPAESVHSPRHVLRRRLQLFLWLRWRRMPDAVPVPAVRA